MDANGNPPGGPTVGYAFTSPFERTALKDARVGARLRSPTAGPFWMVVHLRPRVTGELLWPARSWKLEIVEAIDPADLAAWGKADGPAYLRAREVAVLEELALADHLGPRGGALAALFDRTLTMTAADADALALGEAPPEAPGAGEGALAQAARTISWRLVARRAREMFGVTHFPSDPGRGGEVLPPPWYAAGERLADAAARLARGEDPPEDLARALGD